MATAATAVAAPGGCVVSAGSCLRGAERAGRTPGEGDREVDERQGGSRTGEGRGPRGRWQYIRATSRRRCDVMDQGGVQRAARPSAQYLRRARSS